MKQQNIFKITTLFFMLMSFSLFSQEAPLAPNYQVAKVIISGQDYFNFDTGESMVVKFHHEDGTVVTDDDPNQQAANWYVFSSTSTSPLDYVTASGRALQNVGTLTFVYRLKVDEIVEQAQFLTYIYAHWSKTISEIDPNINYY